MRNTIVQKYGRRAAALLTASALTLGGSFMGAPMATAAPLESAFPAGSAEAQAARQLATVPGFKDVTATDYRLNKARESGRQEERLRVINYRRDRLGIPALTLDPVAEMVAHTAADVFRDWNTRLATQLKPPHAQEGKCVVRQRERAGRQLIGTPDLLWGGIREYCYRPFVIRNSPLRTFAYWVSRVSLGEQLFSKDVVAAGISGAPRQVSLLGERDDLVVVVLKTREKQSVLDAERPWDSGLLRILTGYMQQIQKGKTPQEFGDDAVKQSALAALFAPLYKLALQRAFINHGVNVQVQPSVRAQMWADSLAAAIKTQLEDNITTPEKVGYEVAQLPLLANVYKSQNQFIPYKQHIFIEPAWVDIFTVFRNINAGDTVFREANARYGATPVPLGDGNILWVLVSQK